MSGKLNVEKYKRILIVSAAESFEQIKKITLYASSEFNSTLYALVRSEKDKRFISLVGKEENCILLPTLLKSQKNLDHVCRAELLKKIKVCEELVGIPVSRVLLAEEREIGRAYSLGTYYFPHTRLAKKTLRDSELATRVLLSSFEYAFNIFERYGPTLCISGMMGGLFTLVFFYVSHYYNVPYVSYNVSKYLTGRHMWVSNWGGNNEHIADAYKALGCDHIPSIDSKEYIKQFIKKPEPLSFYKNSWKNPYPGVSYRATLKAIISRLIYNTIPLIRGVAVANQKPFFTLAWELHRCYFLSHIHKRKCNTYTTKELEELRYIYYPAHQDPEMVLNVRGTSWYSQLNTIKMLSYNLPIGTKLLVREHRNNIGRRPLAYINKIISLPNVVLISAYDDQYKYISNANLVVTVNGTSGFEGLMFKKPVLTLDKTEYDVIGFVKKYRDYEDMGTLILDAMTQSVMPSILEQKLGAFLDAERNITFDKHSSPQAEWAFIEKHVINHINFQSEKQTELV